MGHADVGEEQPQVVVDLGDRADRRTRVRPGRLLLDRDGRRQAVDQVDVRLLHLLEELAGVGGQRFDIAPLALGVDRVEGERGLARPRQAGNDDQPVTREVDVDILEVVDARAAHRNPVVRHREDGYSGRFRSSPKTAILARGSVEAETVGTSAFPGFFPEKACHRGGRGTLARALVSFSRTSSGPYRQVFAANTDRAISNSKPTAISQMSRGVRQRRPATSSCPRAHTTLCAHGRDSTTRAPDRTVPKSTADRIDGGERCSCRIERHHSHSLRRPREDETSIQRGGSARRWSRNHLVDVVGEIAQSKSATILRPVPTCRNGRYFYCTCHDQRRSDGRSCLNFSRFHFSSLFSPLKPPFRDDDGARIAPSAQTRQSAGVVKVEMARR